jgi:hypothetical protein
MCNKDTRSNRRPFDRVRVMVFRATFNNIFVLVDQLELPASSSFITVWIDSKLDKYEIQLVIKTDITEHSTENAFS